MVQVRITFLWNFCHLFPVLYYEWNTSIDDNLFVFFLEIISWKGTLLFNGGFIFKWEVPHMGHQFWRWGGGATPMPTSHYGKPWIRCSENMHWVYRTGPNIGKKGHFIMGTFLKQKAPRISPPHSIPFLSLVICIKIKLCIIFIKGGRISLSDALKV